MPAPDKELLYALLVGCLVFVVLSGFIILLIYLHGQKSRRMKTERELMNIQFQQQMLQSQLEVEEQTRRNIALDLHDNLGALSSLIKINLGLFSQETSQQRKEEIIDESRNLTRQLTTEIKELAIRLNTDRINQLLFSEIMQIEIERLRKLGLFKVSLEVMGEEYALDTRKQIMVYRICQEVLHNALKYAKAESIEVKITFNARTLLINIHDDGIGFDPIKNKTNEKLGGSGINNLKNRVSLLNGVLELKSSPGNGTQYNITIPIQTSTHERAN